MAGVNRMSAPNADEWQSEAFRMSMVKKLEEAIQEYGLQGQRDPQTIEQQVFTRAKTREDYLNCIARFILMIQGQRTNQGGQMGGSAAQGNPNMQGGGQINQQDQVGYLLAIYNSIANDKVAPHNITLLLIIIFLYI